MRSKIIGGLLCVFILMGSFFQDPISCAKNSKKPVEKVDTWDDTIWVTRSKFGLVARNVSSMELSGFENFSWNIYIMQNNKKIVKEVDLFHRKRGKQANYKLNTVSKKVKGYYPMIDRILLLDQKNRLLETGYEHCLLFENHTSKKQCQTKKQTVNKIVQRELNVKKCWHDMDMFAYVKNNTLYVTGIAATPYNPSTPDHEEPACYEYDTVRQFFQGRANGIRDVVCGEDCGAYGNNIFVLMKDGSVWGMGSNRGKLISNNQKRYYEDFVKIIPRGVKKIAACAGNVAVIKNNNDLFVWGHTMKSKSSKKYKNSATPRRIAKNVKDVDISGTDTTLVYLKKNGVAYGMGLNKGYALTARYKSGWHSRPVKLMKNIKRVYSAGGQATLLLKKNKDLYWTGTDECTPCFDWVAKKLSKK